jgi:hypothetical protein
MPQSYLLQWNARTQQFEKYNVKSYIPDPDAEPGDYPTLPPGTREDEETHEREPDPGEWFKEAEMKVKVDKTCLLQLPQPWILVQGYWMLDDHEITIRLIPARKMAFFRLKSLTYGERDKMSFRIPYEMGRHLAFYAQGVAFKYRFIKRDDTKRAWLVDYFPEIDWWQAETEFPYHKMHKIPRWPVWATEDITEQPIGYTRERARSRSFKEHQIIMEQAEEFGSREEYEPGGDDFNWLGDTREEKPE